MRINPNTFFYTANDIFTSMGFPTRLKPRVATLNLTFRCNSRCEMCPCWKLGFEEKKNELNTADWKKIIDDLNNFGIKMYVFSVTYASLSNKLGSNGRHVGI